MALTTDVQCAYLGPLVTRAADTKYSVLGPSDDTGPCWFRGAWLSFEVTAEQDSQKFEFYDGDVGGADAFLTVGIPTYHAMGIFVGADECYIDVPTVGIYVSSTSQVSIRGLQLTVFYS